MARKMLLLIMLGFSLAIGSFWVLRAQDPTTPKPEPTPKPETTKTQPQTTTHMSQQVDLSGTYAGTFNCEEAGLVGDTTLTINGNEFTTADGRKGRIIASKTRGYTAVALQMAGAGSPVISFRGKKSGNKLTLQPVAGATQQCMFTTSKTTASKGKTPAATGTEVANPSTTTPSTMPAQSPSPTPSPSPEASPEPNPSPMPSPTPGGSPRPVPSPTASPSPGASPTPSPTPSPAPARVHG